MMRKFRVEFTAKNLTGNAGLVHLGQFADKLQLSKTLKHIISLSSGDIPLTMILLRLSDLDDGCACRSKTHESLGYHAHRFCY